MEYGDIYMLKFLNMHEKRPFSSLGDFLLQELKVRTLHKDTQKFKYYTNDGHTYGI